MRGKDALCNDAESNRGITPAYAGKRWPDCRHQPQAGDHPRVCGEKVRSVSGRAASLGSPPRVRGKGTSSASTTALFRITPACAGKSPPESDFAGHRWDHPRVCGEKGLSMFWSLNHSGSPPRMRGKAETMKCEFGAMRITPAYAGKRNLGNHPPQIIQDHPRVCGEKIRLQLCNLPGMGSPPRMRGKVISLFLIEVSRGITPAYAGKRFCLDFY